MSPYRPVLIVQVEIRRDVSEIEIRLPIGVNRAHIPPVGHARDLVDAAIDKSMRIYAVAWYRVRNHILAEIVGRTSLIMITNHLLEKKLRVEHVNAHADKREPGLTGNGSRLLGLFGKTGDAPVTIDAHDAKLPRRLHRDVNARDSHIRGLRDMVGQQFAVVHLVNMIAAQDHHIGRIVAMKNIDVLVYRVGGSLIPGFLDALLSG